MKKDFVEVTPASGSNNGSFNVVCDKIQVILDQLL